MLKQLTTNYVLTKHLLPLTRHIVLIAFQLQSRKVHQEILGNTVNEMNTADEMNAAPGSEDHISAGAETPAPISSLLLGKVPTASEYQ